MLMKNRTASANYRGPVIGLRAGAIAVAMTISGCAVSSPPIAHTPNVVANPQHGELAISVTAAADVGDVVPVYVSVANGSDDPRAVVPTQVFAVNESGQRVAPLAPSEAARQAGSAKELSSAVRSAAISGAGGAAVGAATGAVAGVAGNAGDLGFGSAGAGALIGTAFGGAYGLISGAQKGQALADDQANKQIGAVALKPAEVRKDFTVSGYVFFPKGQYKKVEMLLVDRNTGDTEVVRGPWH
jgi:hypothetical protein